MAKNNNKSVYNACKIDNSTSTENYLSLEGISLNSNAFSFDMWIYILDNSSILLSQEGGFTCGIENGIFCFSYPEHGKQYIRSDVLVLNKKEWVNIFVSYDGVGISFAMNGVPVGRKSCVGVTLMTGEAIDIGRGFNGYCRGVRIYDFSVPAEEYKKYLFQTVYEKDKMPGIAAFINLMDKDMPDLGSSGIVVRPHGSCGVVDLAHYYKPSIGKYAFLDQGGGVNPGGFESGEFGIYIKAYMRPSDKEIQVLVSNGNFGEDDSVIVYTKWEDTKNISVCLQLGSKSFKLAGSISVFQWVDVIACFGSGKVTAFINGEMVEFEEDMQKRISKGELKIGNGFDAVNTDLTCEHYISVAAIFDKILVQQDADDFLENHPFIFEDGLIALLSFDKGFPKELVSCRDIHLDSGDLGLAQRTFEELPQTPYKYRLNQTQKKVSDMRKWEAETIWDGLVGYYKEAYGLEPVLSQEQKDAAVNNIAQDTEMIQLFASIFTATAVTGALVAQTISAISAAKMAKITGLMSLSTSGAAAVGGASAAAGAAGVGAAGAGLSAVSAGFAKLFVTVAALGIIAVIAAEIVSEYRKNKPDDDEDDDDETPVIKLLALSFQHSPDTYSQSAVRCRSYEGSIVAPEWTKNKRSGAVAVYIADQIASLKIKVKFIIQDNSKKPAGSYNVSLWSFASPSNVLLDGFEHIESGLASGVEYERELTAKNLSVLSNDIYVNDIKLWWNCKVNNSTSTLPNTEVKVYTLPTVPVDPIYMQADRPNDNIQVECLSIFAKEYTAESALTATAADLAAKTNQLYLSPIFRYNSMLHPYVTIYDVVTQAVPPVVMGHVNCLNWAQLMQSINNYNGNPVPANVVQANCNVYASMLCYSFSLLGVISYVCILQTGNPPMQLQTNLLVPAPGGGDAQQYQFIYHAIVRVPPQENVPGLIQNAYYDACCRTPGGGILANLFFRTDFAHINVQATEANTYRGMVFQQGTPAIEDSIRPVMAYAMLVGV